MSAVRGAFIMVACLSVFAHFTRDTPEEKQQAQAQAEANVDRLLEQWENWKYARAFDVGDYVCSPVHDHIAKVEPE